VDLKRKPGRRRAAAALTALSLAIVIPTSASGAAGYTTSKPDYVSLAPGISGSVEALINSGESPFGTIFEGIPDGIGVRPADDGGGYVDLYVTHEQSHVPFGTTATNVFADFQDSSVSRVRVDLASRSVTELSVPLSPDLGFIRFCSAFMAGPEQGFPHYTFIVNEESNDLLSIPAGAPYGADPSVTPKRQGGYSAFLDTETGKVGVLAGAGRHNHENQVVVPGWKKGIVSLSGDDTFTTTSSVARPNLSQMYLYTAKNAAHYLKDDGTLMAFRVTGTQAGAVNPANPQNNANDFFEISVGDSFSGEFIPVPSDVAHGTTGALAQDALEDWSNANNVFQFIRIEDIAYDPDQPRVVYFTDTGNSRLIESADSGRLWRAPAGTTGTSASTGRIFKMVMNAADPTKVDAFSVLAEASAVRSEANAIPAMRNPDNIAVGHDSIMVQEDVANAKIWRYSLSSGTWTHVASAVQPEAETSGIVDVSKWFGAGWWALDVQSHIPLEPISDYMTWTTQPIPPGGDQYRIRREDGQLLLMHIDNS
jgi:hypothetical protein